MILTTTLLLVAVGSAGALLQRSPRRQSNSLRCDQAVRVFLAAPDKPGLTHLSNTDESACWAIVGSSNNKLNQLNRWTEQGNRWAAEYLTKHIKRLDGGNLEDALIALGRFSDHDMDTLLVFAQRGLLSNNQFTDALTMLPLSLSDDPQAQLELLKARRNSVERVDRKDLSEQRAHALAAIRDFASEITSKTSRPMSHNDD